MRPVQRHMRQTRLYGFARKLYHKLSGRPRHPLQDFPNKNVPNLSFLGSNYGGWFFVDQDILRGATIISAGLGEDASFDVEFAQKYGAKVIMVDPTPRAVRHFEQISARLGCKNSRGYSSGGAQPAEAYDLTALGADSLVLVDKALWVEKTKLRFFEPANPNYVSHSIVNYKNDYSDSTAFIEVEGVAFSDVLAQFDLEFDDIPLIKLDIEGAEFEVLTQCMKQGFKPGQILVEFDEISVPSEKGFDRVTQLHALLKSHGYEMIRSDGPNFLYVMR